MDSFRSSRTSLTLLVPHNDPQICDHIFKSREKLQAVTFPDGARFPARTPTTKVYITSVEDVDGPPAQELSGQEVVGPNRF